MSNSLKLSHNPGLPNKINNYKLDENCFEISGNKYFFATNTYINEKVLIRIIEKEQLNKSLDEIAYIRNEIFITKFVNHKNILRLYEIIESKYYIFLIYEYFQGEPLTNFFNKKQKLQEKEILTILHKLLNALLYLHESMKISHLTLNLDSILIDNNLNIKLINFKNSRFYEEKLNTVLNLKDIFLFAAPEVHAKLEYFPELADVYSCGVILFYLSTGDLPFKSSRKVVSEQLIMKGEYVLPDNLSEKLFNLISLLLTNQDDVRPKLLDVLKGNWFNDNIIIKGLNVLHEKYPIDEKVIKICCEEYKIDKKESIIKKLNDNVLDNVTSLYKQIENKLNKINISTLCDLISNKFNNYISNSENYYDNDNIKKKYLNCQNQQSEIATNAKKNESNFAANQSLILQSLERIFKKYKNNDYKDNKTKPKKSIDVTFERGSSRKSTKKVTKINNINIINIAKKSNSNLVSSPKSSNVNFARAAAKKNTVRVKNSMRLKGILKNNSKINRNRRHSSGFQVSDFSNIQSLISKRNSSKANPQLNFEELKNYNDKIKKNEKSENLNTISDDEEEKMKREKSKEQKLKEQKIKEQKLREQKIKEQKMKELKEKEQKEKEEREKEKKEREQFEKDQREMYQKEKENKIREIKEKEIKEAEKRIREREKKDHEEKIKSQKEKEKMKQQMEKLKKEQEEEEKIQKEKIQKEKLQKEKLQKEKLLKEKSKKEKILKEKEEKEKLLKEKEEREQEEKLKQQENVRVKKIKFKDDKNNTARSRNEEINDINKIFYQEKFRKTNSQRGIFETENPMSANNNMSASTRSINKNYRKTYKKLNKDESKPELFSLKTVEMDIKNYAKKKTSKNTLKLNGSQSLLIDDNNTNINIVKEKEKTKKKPILKKKKMHRRIYSLQMKKEIEKKEKLDKDKMDDYNKEFLNLIFNGRDLQKLKIPQKKINSEELSDEEKNKNKKVKKNKAKISKYNEYSDPRNNQREIPVKGKKISKMVENNSNEDEESEEQSESYENQKNLKKNKNQNFVNTPMNDFEKNDSNQGKINSPKKKLNDSPSTNQIYSSYNDIHFVKKLTQQQKLIKNSGSQPLLSENLRKKFENNLNDNNVYNTNNKLNNTNNYNSPEPKKIKNRKHKRVISCGINSASITKINESLNEKDNNIDNIALTEKKPRKNINNSNAKNKNQNNKLKSKIDINLFERSEFFGYKLRNNNRINHGFCNDIDYIKLKLKNKLIDITDELQSELRYYRGPINIIWVSLLNVEDSMEEFEKKMKKYGFKCKRMPNNRFKCNKGGKIYLVELVKIHGNMLYYLFGR